MKYQNRWIWAVVQDPGGKEQFLGQRDPEKGIAFIPAFLEKALAYQCLNQLARDKTLKYEPQAVLFEEIRNHAHGNAMALLILDGEGNLVDGFYP
jgi:hypothetical protein